MAFKIQETFQVPAAGAEVWEFLVDPREVVQCLPGAELLQAQGENTFLGRARVKVGPVTATYKGTATFVERDDENRVVRLEGEGQESAGAGSARMAMSCRLTELSPDRTEVRVDAEIEVVGRVVQFGRGMIEEVNRQLFRQFVACAQQRFATPAGAETAGGMGAGEPRTAARATAEAATPGESVRPAQDSPRGKPLHAMPLLLKAISALVGRFFARLFRRR